MQNTIVNVNGRLIDQWDKAQVSVFDRSYLYGDSLYEVARTYDGVFFALKEHLQRLEESARLCRMVLSQTAEHFAGEMNRSLAAFRALKGQGDAEAYCRLIVSRGVGRIGFGLNALLTPTQYAIIVQPLADFSASLTKEKFEKGASLAISERLRNHPLALDPAMKSGNYLNSLLAFLEASAEDFDDALMVNHDGHLTEGTTFNFFYAHEGRLATPPLDIGILDGITRRRVIDLAREQRIPVREVRFPRERLYEADEAFISSSIKEVFPITRVDGRKIGSGKPGPVTRRLAEAFKLQVKKEIRAHG